jgi:hypothetical protein
LQLALRFGGRCAGALCRDVSARDAAPGSCLDTSGRALKRCATGIYYTGDLTSQCARLTERILQRSNALFRKYFATLKERAVRTNALPRKIKRELLVSRKICNALLRQVNLLLHQAVGKVRNTRTVLPGSAYRHRPPTNGADDLTALLKTGQGSRVIAH